MRESKSEATSPAMSEIARPWKIGSNRITREPTMTAAAVGIIGRKRTAHASTTASVQMESLGGSSAVVSNRTKLEHIEALFQAAKTSGYDVFISPHYYYPTDDRWQFGGTVEKMMHDINMFSRQGALILNGFEGSGADWLDRYKPFIEDGNTIVTSPHKVYGPESNDLVLQLRKRGKSQVLLAGMSANLCVEAHLRELLEQGFEVAVIKDATAAAQHPELGDGYAGCGHPNRWNNRSEACGQGVYVYEYRLSSGLFFREREFKDESSALFCGRQGSRLNESFQVWYKDRASISLSNSSKNDHRPELSANRS